MEEEIKIEELFKLVVEKDIWTLRHRAGQKLGVNGSNPDAHDAVQLACIAAWRSLEDIEWPEYAEDCIQLIRSRIAMSVNSVASSIKRASKKWSEVEPYDALLEPASVMCDYGVEDGDVSGRAIMENFIVLGCSPERVSELMGIPTAHVVQKLNEIKEKLERYDDEI